MCKQRLGFVLITFLFLAVCVPAVAAKDKRQINYHPGWLNPTPGSALDVAEGWLTDGDGWWPIGHSTEGTYTFGVNNPNGFSNDGSDFWNPSDLYSPSSLWIYDEGVVLESNYQATSLLTVTASTPWLFVQFSVSDMNDGIAEIAVKEVGWTDWFTVGSCDTFGHGNHWVSIEGLPLGSYYIRITSRWNGRNIVPPNNPCPPGHANGLQIARIGTTAAVPRESIQITGGGWAPIDGGTANVNMDIAVTGGQAKPTGTFTYADNVANLSIQSTEILGIEVIGDEAWLRLAGVSDVGTYHTVFVYLRQGGAGVGALRTRVSADWTGCASNWIYNKLLTLGRGQIRIH